MPSSSATTCAIVVSMPWPCEPVPSETVTCPLGFDAYDRRLRAHRVHHSGARLDVEAEPDAEEPSLVRERAPLFGAERVVADDLRGLLERLRRADHVERNPRRQRVGKLAPSRRRCAAALERIDADLARGGVDHLLARDGLEHPRPAVGAAPARVGPHPAGPECRLRTPVRAGEQHGRRADRRRRSRRPGTRRRPRCDRCRCRATWPSASSANVQCAASARAWFEAMRFSRRSSIHLSARPSRRAASATTSSSRGVKNFWPKPPPTSCACTRTRCDGTPATRAIACLASCGFCVLIQACSSPAAGSYAADDPARLHRDGRVPVLAERAVRRRCRSATAPRARARSGRPSPCRGSVPSSGCTIGVPSSSACSTSITAGAASMSTSTSSAASSAT